MNEAGFKNGAHLAQHAIGPMKWGGIPFFVSSGYFM